jgi:hypothetical protein
MITEVKPMRLNPTGMDPKEKGNPPPVDGSTDAPTAALRSRQQMPSDEKLASGTRRMVI